MHTHTTYNYDNIIYMGNYLSRPIKRILMATDDNFLVAGLLGLFGKESKEDARSITRYILFIFIVGGLILVILRLIGII